MIRRLDPNNDRECFVEAWIWETNAPQWYKTSDRIFGPATFEDWIEASKEETRATFGVFEPELIGLIILTLKGKGVFEVDLLAKPKCDGVQLALNGMALAEMVFQELGAKEIFCWVNKKNYPTKRLCATIGFRDSGLRLIKGQYRDRVIIWERLSLLPQS